MTVQVMESLVSLIEQWLRDHGAVFAARFPTVGIGIPNLDVEPVNPDERVDLYTLPTPEERRLLIGPDTRYLTILADHHFPPDSACVCEPGRWRDGLLWATAEADKVRVRRIVHVPVAEVDPYHPGYLIVRLDVLLK